MVCQETLYFMDLEDSVFHGFGSGISTSYDDMKLPIGQRVFFKNWWVKCDPVKSLNLLMILILRFFLQVTSTVGFFQYFFANEATQQLQDL